MFDRDMDPIEDPEVYQEWIAAVQKHGLTFNIQHARQVLPVLLSMKPETVEAYCSTRYGEM